MIRKQLVCKQSELYPIGNGETMDSLKKGSNLILSYVSERSLR